MSVSNNTSAELFIHHSHRRIKWNHSFNNLGLELEMLKEYASAMQTEGGLSQF